MSRLLSVTKIGAFVAGTLAFLLSANGARAGIITYICDPSISAVTCNYLNTTIAGLYSSTFTDANASIYIQYGTTGLAQNNTPLNAVSYSAYVAALAANPHMDALQAS